ncbi:ABC transporter permease [Deinococcus radiophilus]|uniref:ABC transporter permease n=1 Tax=Deinococcus radiophilus TaxID=32062 RepID=A0A431VS46_9DEIO|nr:ABC transporter permease [Deinococcus radiophilus]RTR25923.1 ABC transporter permease [Deinococcus radiophilus]UFA49716.1 ABC transporter permease [Deinococcus radiophilus]
MPKASDLTLDPRKVRLIAGLSLKESLRKRLVAVLLILTALFVGFYLYGIYRMYLDFQTRPGGLDPVTGELGSALFPVNFATIFGMYLVAFLGSLMAVLSTVGSVSADVESGVVQSVVSRPVSRAELVMGRWLGFSVVNVGYVLLVSVVMLAGIYLITGFLPPSPLAAISLMLLGILLITALTVLGSTLFTTLANGIGVFVLYGVGIAGGILNSIGNMVNSPTMLTLARVANTLMPTNEMWLGASYFLQHPEFTSTMSMSPAPLPFIGTDPVGVGMILWSAALTVLAVLAAMWHFSRRDL